MLVKLLVETLNKFTDKILRKFPEELLEKLLNFSKAPGEIVGGIPKERILESSRKDARRNSRRIRGGTV